MDFSRGRSKDREEEHYRQESRKHPLFESSFAEPSKHGRERAIASPAVVKEHMFDKVVTPSDVGKLNRLVIPKQHAEKYFPLDPVANEKGLLLSFEEDRTGKPWCFRYSYWNSSQSYVMTKGWSRFVKEKRLDAGDTISFARGVGEAARGRLFIDWKTRPVKHLARCPPTAPQHSIISFARSAPWGTGGRLFMPLPPPPVPTPVFDRHIRQRYSTFAYNTVSVLNGVGGQNGIEGQRFFFRSPAQSTLQLEARTKSTGSTPLVLDSVPVADNQGMGKRVRLFGVNLNCPDSDKEDLSRPAPALQLQLGPAIPRSTSSSSSSSNNWI